MATLLRPLTILLLLGLALPACSSGKKSGPLPSAPRGGTIAGSLVADCSGADCGASDDTTYSGSGVGFWKYVNTSTSASASVPVNLTGVLGREVTMVFTNLSTGTNQSFPSLPSFSSQPRPVRAQQPIGLPRPSVKHFPHEKQVSRDKFIRMPLAAQLSQAFTPGPGILAANHPVGYTRNFKDLSGNDFATTLVYQHEATDGRWINVYVQDSQRQANGGDVTDAMLTTLGERFADDAITDSIYTMATAIAGQPWGVHLYGNLLASNQELDVVFYDIDEGSDTDPYGTVGYFWSLHNFLASDDPDSNESLSIYLDTETLAYSPLADPDAGMNSITSTLAHELTHMINFYQREVSLSNGFDTWAEEMSAMMMEDILGLDMVPTYNDIRDNRFPEWIANPGFNCSLTNWVSSFVPCFSYNIAGSFGGFLLRKYGISFYQHYLTNVTGADSLTQLDGSLAASGSNFNEEFRRWGASIALLPSPGTPAGYGYPERIDSGHTIPAIDGPSLSAYLNLPSTPTTLNYLGHHPVQVTPATDTMSSTVTVPPNTALTVVVQ